MNVSASFSQTLLHENAGLLPARIGPIDRFNAEEEPKSVGMELTPKHGNILSFDRPFLLHSIFLPLETFNVHERAIVAIIDAHARADTMQLIILSSARVRQNWRLMLAASLGARSIHSVSRFALGLRMFTIFMITA